MATPYSNLKKTNSLFLYVNRHFHESLTWNLFAFVVVVVVVVVLSFSFSKLIKRIITLSKLYFFSWPLFRKLITFVNCYFLKVK